MANIWVWIETFKDQPAGVSLEALGLARELSAALGGGPVSALVFGGDVAGLAGGLGSAGADRVLAASDASLADFRLEPYAALLAQLAREQQPDIVLAGATTGGRDLFASVAAELNAPLIADITAYRVEAGQLEATRPVYAGKLLATLVPGPARPVLLTVRARAFAAAAERAGFQPEVVTVPAALAEDQITTKVDEWVLEGEGQVSLTDARVIVSGGRGVANNALTAPNGLDPKQLEIWRAQQGFTMLGDLAGVLGAAVGASRAAVDAGYIPYAHQVGQTGKTVAPDLYVAVGISGAIQHQAGMRTSKNIVAINKDAEAPIFRIAQYGIVGDMFKIVPALTEELRRRLGK
jgi:electron transfer flavoprotein alpha subunit